VTELFSHNEENTNREEALQDEVMELKHSLKVLKQKRTAQLLQV
jgi:hypothetical protein